MELNSVPVQTLYITGCQRVFFCFFAGYPDFLKDVVKSLAIAKRWLYLHETKAVYRLIYIDIHGQTWPFKTRTKAGMFLKENYCKALRIKQYFQFGIDA